VITLTTKRVLIFVPLGLFLAGIFTIRWDLKHPRVNEKDQCQITAIGLDVVTKKRRQVMGFGGQPIHNLAFDCVNHGRLLVNDAETFRQSVVEVGQPVVLTHKEYQFFPERWQFQIYPIYEGDASEPLK